MTFGKRKRRRKRQAGLVLKIMVFLNYFLICMPQGDVTCCRCGQDLSRHGYLWKAVLWWCDNCYDHVCRDVVVTGILPHKGCTLPQKYSSVHIDELHGTIPLWMAPKTMEDFHEPEENRKWVFYNLNVSIWQCKNGERRYVVRILERPDHHGEQPSPCRCEVSTHERRRRHG